MENLNYVDIIMLLLLAGFTIGGLVEGFLVTVLNLARSVVGYGLCFYASTKLTPIIYTNYVQKYMYDHISEKLASVADLDAITSSINSTIDSLPANLKSVVDLSALQSVNNKNAVELMMNSVVEPVANIVIRITVFAIVFALFFIITGVIISLIKKIKNHDKSSLKAVDRIFGAVFGILKFGVVAFALITVFEIIAPYSTNDGGFIATVQSSAVVDFLSQYNPFVALLGGLK